MTNPLLVSFCFLQVKVTQELKNTHTEQMTRLHFKHQTECDLLEDMRYEHICITRMYEQFLSTAKRAEEYPHQLPDDLKPTDHCWLRCALQCPVDTAMD